MPLETLLQNPSPPVTRTRSILSRIPTSFSKRSAKFFELEIEPEHPHKTYRPGDSVRGQIILTVFKGFDITHLAISLHGYARVYKHQCAPGDARNIPEQLFNGQGSHGFQYHGNGLAALFQDEQMLCGSGFLKKQVYKFGFELQFPQYSLPSTIEFERGAVNYLITATVTRPTTIAPTTNRIYKVKFENRIDIESMYAPRSRAIYLEPMTRRGKVKKVKQPSPTEISASAVRPSLSRQNTPHTTHDRPATTAPAQHPPLSPAPSEDTVVTNATTSTHSLQIIDNQSAQHKESDNSEPRSSTTSTSVHTISATTEIVRHGALPGDQVSVRVKVEHTKAVRGMVIATLYRQGRIDMLPDLPLVSKLKDKKPEYEDVYPKSRTGLGGLYFTNGTPNMAFRKDLTQTSTMMIVDPSSLMADVNFKVRIPDEAFPTMDNIPGGMISFTYHVEVVIDLTGKLGESRFLPSLTTNGPTFSNVADGGKQLTHEWANNILDTTPLRRTKNVVSFDLPLVVGTEDSARLKKSQENAQPRQDFHGKQPVRSLGAEDDARYWHQEGYDSHDQRHNYNAYHAYHDGWYDENSNPVYDGQHGHYQHDYDHPPLNNAQPPPAHHYNVPAPQGEDHMDEKSRLRRQEELLLPSQPPDTGGSSSQAQAFTPSAPVLDGDLDHPLSNSGSFIPITVSRASARSADTVVPDPMTPPHSVSEHSIPALLEDKQELERRRLQAQASAPSTNDEGEADPRGSRGRIEAASAPVINEEEEYMAQMLREDVNETLPQYRR